MLTGGGGRGSVGGKRSRGDGSGVEGTARRGEVGVGSEGALTPARVQGGRECESTRRRERRGEENVLKGGVRWAAVVFKGAGLLGGADLLIGRGWDLAVGRGRRGGEEVEGGDVVTIRVCRKAGVVGGVEVNGAGDAKVGVHGGVRCGSGRVREGVRGGGGEMARGARLE